MNEEQGDLIFMLFLSTAFLVVVMLTAGCMR